MEPAVNVLPTTAYIFSGNKVSNLNIHIILMGFHLHGLKPVRLWHKAAKWHIWGCLWERSHLPPSTQSLPPVWASWRQPVGGNCVPQQGDESHWGSSPFSLMANTREQLSVQSHVRFDFTLVTEKGHNTLLCNRGLCARREKSSLSSRTMLSQLQRVETGCEIT